MDNKLTLSLVIAIIGLIVAVFALLGGGSLLGINSVLVPTLTEEAPAAPTETANIQPLPPTEQFVAGERN